MHIVLFISLKIVFFFDLVSTVSQCQLLKHNIAGLTVDDDIKGVERLLGPLCAHAQHVIVLKYDDRLIAYINLYYMHDKDGCDRLGNEYYEIWVQMTKFMC